MKKKDARDAVRELMRQHVEERKRFDMLDMAVRPWSEYEARRKMGIPPGVNRGWYERIARMSQTPLLGLVLDVYGQSLKVDGLFASDASPAGGWQWWQANAMDARQVGLHRAALQYGSAFASVLPAVSSTGPGDTGAGAAAKIGVHSPRRLTAFYGDSLAWRAEETATQVEFPIIALAVGKNHLRLFDEENVYYFGVEHTPGAVDGWLTRGYFTDENLPFIEARPHGLGVTPIVRYQDRMLAEGEESRGIIEHLLTVQDRVDRTNFEQGVAQHFTAFVQRYVIGWMPSSEQEQLRQRASDVWAFADPDVKVGQFPSADLSPYIESRRAAIRDFAAVAQLPSQSLGAEAISNISADGLAALEKSKEDKVSEIQTSLGESHEQLLRLCSHAVGDTAGARDYGSEVKWAEMSARSFAQTVDGLGKLATMLNIPAEELWGDIPGWTRDRVDRAQKRAASTRVLGPGLLDPEQLDI